MDKLKIKIIRLGYIPFDIDFKKIIKNKSLLFDVDKYINDYILDKNSDGGNWGYSDDILEKAIPNLQDNINFIFCICNVPLENNYYSRRLKNNKIIFTLFQMAEILKSENIPIENLILMKLYSYSFVYKMYNNRIPSKSEKTSFAHDETKGCIFDMTGYKSDVIYSCYNPIICDDCYHNLSKSKIPIDIIKKVRKEIKRIKKKLFYKLFDFVKNHPILSIIISFIFGVVVNLTIKCFF